MAKKEKEFKGFIPAGEMTRRILTFQSKHEKTVDRLIREAEEAGKFSNLANEGKPIKLEKDNPYVAEDMRLAYKILENAGCAPPWIELDKDVEAQLDQARQEREQHRRWLVHRLDQIKNGAYQHFLRDLRQLAQTHEYWLQGHRRRLEELNNRIHSFNNICPVPQLQKIPLIADKVLQEYDNTCPTLPRV